MKVLFVCSGNAYRSPLAEALLKKMRPDLQLDSAGTNVENRISGEARRYSAKQNAGQYLKMCFQLSELNLKDPVVLEDQLTGVDTAYFMQLIERCKRDLKKDPSIQVNSAYIVSLVDRMF